jgi:hypothetical protein
MWSQRNDRLSTITKVKVSSPEMKKTTYKLDVRLNIAIFGKNP